MVLSSKILPVCADDRVDRFLKEGGLRCIVELAGSGSLAVKKHAGLALYALARNGEPFCGLNVAGSYVP